MFVVNAPVRDLRVAVRHLPLPLISSHYRSSFKTGRKLVSGVVIILISWISFISTSQARSVAGTIRDKQTTLGVPGVIVRILETGDSTQTNSSGSYFFANVPDGSYTFFIAKHSYEPETMANTHVPNTCCAGKRGNVNCAGIIDLSDLSSLVSYLTGGGYVLCCVDAANINGVGIVDLSDLSSLVSYLTGGGYVLPSCP